MDPSDQHAAAAAAAVPTAVATPCGARPAVTCGASRTHPWQALVDHQRSNDDKLSDFRISTISYQRIWSTIMILQLTMHSLNKLSLLMHIHGGRRA